MATTGIGKSKYYKQEKKKIKENQQQNVDGDVLTPGSRTPIQKRKEKESSWEKTPTAGRVGTNIF